VTWGDSRRGGGELSWSRRVNKEMRRGGEKEQETRTRGGRDKEFAFD